MSYYFHRGNMQLIGYVTLQEYAFDAEISNRLDVILDGHNQPLLYTCFLCFENFSACMNKSPKSWNIGYVHQMAI